MSIQHYKQKQQPDISQACLKQHIKVSSKTAKKHLRWWIHWPAEAEKLAYIYTLHYYCCGKTIIFLRYWSEPMCCNLWDTEIGFISIMHSGSIYTGCFALKFWRCMISSTQLCKICLQFEKMFELNYIIDSAKFRKPNNYTKDTLPAVKLNVQCTKWT